MTRAWLLALAACGGKTAAHAPAPAPSAPASRFAWDPPCRVPVVDTIRVMGQSIVLGFVVDVTSRDDGNLEVALRDFHVLKVADQDAGHYTPAELQQVVAWTTSLPRLVIARDGRIRDVEPAPAAIGAFEAKRYVVDDWNAWVAAWIDRPEVAPGGVVELERTEKLDGDAYLAMSKQTAVGALITGGWSVTHDQVELEAAVLRPRHATIDVTTNVEHDGKSATVVTSRDDVFDWAHAAGCGK